MFILKNNFSFKNLVSDMRVAFGKVGEKHESMNKAMYMYMHSTHMHMYRVQKMYYFQIIKTQNNASTYP